MIAKATDAEDGYDCDGNCLNDADGDGVCDEFESGDGCQDETACNYNADATDDAEDGDCDGNCLHDAAATVCGGEIALPRRRLLQREGADQILAPTLATTATATA